MRVRGQLSESQVHLQYGSNTKHVAMENRKQDCHSTNISTNKHEEMTFICLTVEPEGEQKIAQRKRLTNCGRFCENLQKLSKGLQAGNACLLCLTLY